MVDMTILQIQYAIACAETGSFSKAAQALFTSISNISRTIKALEIELGFDIFLRNNNGIIVTKKGEEFLKHANAIQAECNFINKLCETEMNHHFSCACMHLPYCYMAFEALCKLYQDDENICLSLNTGFLSECIESVCIQQSDIGIISIPENIDSNISEYIKKNGLAIKYLSPQSLNLYIRKNHPALEGYEQRRQFDFSRLQDYPYISYSNYEENVIHPIDLSHHSYFPVGAINTRKAIYINNGDWRHRLIGNTNAFSFGTTGPADLPTFYNTQCIPLPGYTSRLYLIFLEDKTLCKESKDYIELLQYILEKNPC